MDFTIDEAPPGSYLAVACNGKHGELVALGLDPQHLDFKPDVWQITEPDPWQAKTLILSE